MTTIEQADPQPQWLRIGFRPFFLCAMLFAVVTMVQWTLFLHLDWGMSPAGVTASQWHAHELIFGYAGAVIAGFLLTAVKNWTRRDTLTGAALALLVSVWAIARVVALTPNPTSLPVVLALDALYLISLCVALARPLIATGKKQQFAIIGKLVLLLACDIAFFLAVLEIAPSTWASPSLLLGVYTIIGLILMVSRMVLPFFTQVGIPGAGPRPNAAWIDRSSLLLFLAFMLADVLGYFTFSLAIAVAFLAVSAIRLHGWHHPGIWRRPLLWILYVGYALIPLGMLLRALLQLDGFGPTLGLHLMTFGGIGIFTAAMMARVALGHTGRDIHTLPRGLVTAFVLLIVGTLFRTLLPLLAIEQYALWLLLAQLCWIGAFAILIWRYAPILTGPRVDGKYV